MRSLKILPRRLEALRRVAFRAQPVNRSGRCWKAHRLSLLQNTDALSSEARSREMADRFFPNVMPDFVAESAVVSAEAQDSLLKLLAMPYHSLYERFKRAALDLKETIAMETWGMTGQHVRDVTLYSGTLGTAFLLFKAYLVTKNESDLALCSQIVKACASASLGSSEIKLPRNLPDELLYGRVGFLWACSFINKHVGAGTIPATYTRTVVNEIIKNGRALAKRGGSPLMYEWYGEKYWGAAHGLAGIMHVLMDMDLKPDEIEDVKGTLKYMINNRFPSGNYPASEEDRKRDVLVHWCHGAPGVALTLVKAAKVFEDEEFLRAATDAAEVVWNRGLLKRVGICHGISGNAYVFLSLYQLTGNVHFLYRAKAFACFLLDRAHKLISKGEMHGGDSPYSLFEGSGGLAYLFLDMTDASQAKFPAYDL